LRFFIDTSAFVALNDRSDRYHEKAREFILGFSAADELITSNYIVDETITHLRRSMGVKATIEFAEAILSGQGYQIIYIDQEMEQAAFGIFRRYFDNVLSFTDCTSFALMKRMGLNKAFAFDEDFLVAGFEVVP